MTWTQKGLTNAWGVTFRGATPPTTFYLMLFTATAVPDKTTQTVSELVEIAAGNGYTTGGIAVARNSTDFDVLTEADPALIQLADKTWTASGGSLPSSGLGARYAALVDDNATINSREVWHFWDLGSARTVTTGQPLTLSNAEMNGDLP